MTDQAKLIREEQFHDAWARSLRPEDVLVIESFEGPAALENAYIVRAFGDVKGKRILDLGCGAGEGAIYFATRGAQTSGCDISEEFLKVGRSTAERFGVRVDFKKADTAALPFADESFDFVYGNGILHHVDLFKTAQEVRRVLKKGGRAAFIEPLPYNPAINVYREMAKGVRTEDEKPLSFKKLDGLKPFFSEYSHAEFWFLTLLVFIHFYAVRRWNPSKVRYWKKVIEDGESYRGMLESLAKADETILGMLPFLRPLCWNTVVLVTK